jgi:murein DD-endopeptidase MepM/ murein hydrolase activator NlpD
MRRPAAVALALLLAPAAPAAHADQTFRAPIVPPTVDPGCDYGSRDCAYPSHHTGIDYRGDDPPHEKVRVTADGIVRVAATSDESHGFGNAVILEHRRARTGRRVYSLYGHLAAKPKVTVGQCVRRGSSLGLQGDSGDTENVSLHFEIKRRPRFGPPYGYSPGPPGDYGYFDPKAFIGHRRAKTLCARDHARALGERAGAPR